MRFRWRFCACGSACGDGPVALHRLRAHRHGGGVLGTDGQVLQEVHRTDPDETKEQTMTKELENTFTYHAPTADEIERMTRIREAAKALAAAIEECLPFCADRTCAIRHVRDAAMTANSGIVLNRAAWASPTVAM